MKYAVVGGEVRFAHLARMLAEGGRDAQGFLQQGTNQDVAQLADYDCVLSRWPMDRCDEVMRAIPSGTTLLLCGPKFPEARRSDLRYVNLWSDQRLLEENAYLTAEAISIVSGICDKDILHDIPSVEPIGPKKLFDLLIVAPCTGNTLAKIANGITDTPVALAVKSHLRNGKPVLIAVSTNDALGQSAQNIARLLTVKHIYFVPFGQDDPVRKPNSCVAHFDLIAESACFAAEERQIQPVLREY